MHRINIKIVFIMRKISFHVLALLGLSITILYGCSADIAEEGYTPPVTRSAMREATIVWQASPGSINVPARQAVTIGLDGSVTK